MCGNCTLWTLKLEERFYYENLAYPFDCYLFTFDSPISDFLYLYFSESINGYNWRDIIANFHSSILWHYNFHALSQQNCCFIAWNWNHFNFSSVYHAFS